MYALIMSCKDGKSAVVSDYECWGVEHYVHVAFGATFFVTLLSVTIPTSAIFFENNCSSSNSFRKISSLADVLELAFRAILAICLVIFNTVCYLRATVVSPGAVCLRYTCAWDCRC